MIGKSVCVIFFGVFLILSTSVHEMDTTDIELLENIFGFLPIRSINAIFSYCTRENRKIIRAFVLLLQKHSKLQSETKELGKILNANSDEIGQIEKILNSNINSSEISCDCSVSSELSRKIRSSSSSRYSELPEQCMTNKLYLQYRDLLREHNQLRFKKLEIEGKIIEKINVTEVSCICPTSQSPSQRKRRSFATQLIKILVSIGQHGIVVGGTSVVGAYAYSKFSEKSPEDLKRVKIDCKENNYGCHMNRCWKNCGPYLESGDFCLTTNSTLLSVETMTS